MATWNLIENGATFAATANQPAFPGGGAFAFVDLPVIEYNSALYQIAVRVDDSGSQPFPRTIAVYKSTDNGATWSVLDNSNAPTCFYHSAGYDATNNIIWFGYIPTAGNVNLAIVSFDLATETYGTADTGGPATSSNGLSDGRYLTTQVLSTGIAVISYPFVTSTHNGARLVEYNAGWGSPVTLAAGAAAFTDQYVQGSALDIDNDVVYYFIRSTSAGYLYRTYNSPTVSAPTIINVSFFSGDAVNGAYDNGKIYFPERQGQRIGAMTDIALATIDTGTGVVTVEDIADQDVDTGAFFPYVAIGNSNIYVAFMEISTLGDNESFTIYYWRPISGGSWTRVEWSNSTDDPLPDGEVGLPWEVGSSAITILGDGGIGVTGAYGLITACGVLFFSIESGSIPLTIDLDVSLGISFSFGFSGGPPPPPPPPFCETVPAGPSPELIIYNEPLERLGS